MDATTTQAYFNEYSELVWLGLGFALIFVELSIAPGIGLLFAGLAAVTLGGLLTFHVIDAPVFSNQIVFFLALTVMWTLALWRPLKNYLRSSTGIFDMYAGTSAEVKKGDLTKDKTGMVRWSGSDMRARIVEGSDQTVIKEGEEVYVHTMHNGLMHVDVVAPKKNEKNN
jgi:membrane protein implicated in regulation of membrane protease activity